MTTKIEWTDVVWNPVTGCREISDGCKNCYAAKSFNRFSKMPTRGGVYVGRTFHDVQAHEDRLAIPATWVKPRRVFVNSMSDLFHDAVPEDFLYRVFGVMVKERRHAYQVLTKRPERALEFFQKYYSVGGEFPPNIWFGVSVENQATADDRVPWLLRCPFAVRFVSYEPALGAVDLTHWLAPGVEPMADARPVGLRSMKAEKRFNNGIHWVIAGGESGPGARPAHPDWFRSLRDQCEQYSVPYFFKQWGEWMPQGHMASLSIYPHVGARTHTIGCHDAQTETDCRCWRIGKKKAGNLLDGRTHQQFPEVE